MDTQHTPKGQRHILRSVTGRAALGLLATLAVFLWHATPAAAAGRTGGSAATRNPVSVLGGKLVFHDATAQAKEFIGYYHSIVLTPQQEAIKKAALEPMPAACCRNSSAYTCCCPCNLSKTIWGLSNLAISKYRANATDVRQVVQAWKQYVNPTKPFNGETCYAGGCSDPADGGGCAGMEESSLSMRRMTIR